MAFAPFPEAVPEGYHVKATPSRVPARTCCDQKYKGYVILPITSSSRLEPVPPRKCGRLVFRDSRAQRLQCQPAVCRLPRRITFRTQSPLMELKMAAVCEAQSLRTISA